MCITFAIGCKSFAGWRKLFNFAKVFRSEFQKQMMKRTDSGPKETCENVYAKKHKYKECVQKKN